MICVCLQTSTVVARIVSLSRLNTGLQGIVVQNKNHHMKASNLPHTVVYWTHFKFAACSQQNAKLKRLQSGTQLRPGCRRNCAAAETNRLTTIEDKFCLWSHLKGGLGLLPHITCFTAFAD